MQGLTRRSWAALACQSVIVEFASGEPLAWTCPSIPTAAAADLDAPAKRPIRSNDLLIAAHAYATGATIVTGNADEFKRVRGLKVENWLN
jgi:hypothetical protein